ncbi:MAG: hypothetical protein II138_02590 [Paludibacteraceae bacterium]|nr:hypothetical protein [Paludibacteraceae bacterium]MBQ1851343.1 hypothetical protein [Paludibacteraceae bacterium]
MKRNLLWAMAAALVFCSFSLTSCTGDSDNDDAKADAEEAAIEAAALPDTYLAAIERYMINDVAASYAAAEYHIPVDLIVAVNESNPDSILVWGDFWIENYNLSADTLLFVSGGSHPGLMHVAKEGDKYRVTSFDAVADGSGFLPSAKKIFGENFDAFQKLQSDDDLRKDLRRMTILAYVKQNNIPATMYKDYGWDPVVLEK